MHREDIISTSDTLMDYNNNFILFDDPKRRILRIINRHNKGIKIFDYGSFAYFWSAKLTDIYSPSVYLQYLIGNLKEDNALIFVSGGNNSIADLYKFPNSNNNITSKLSLGYQLIFRKTTSHLSKYKIMIMDLPKLTSRDVEFDSNVREVKKVSYLSETEKLHFGKHLPQPSIPKVLWNEIVRYL